MFSHFRFVVVVKLVPIIIPLLGTKHEQERMKQELEKIWGANQFCISLFINILSWTRYMGCKLNHNYTQGD